MKRFQDEELRAYSVHSDVDISVEIGGVYLPQLDTPDCNDNLEPILIAEHPL